MAMKDLVTQISFLAVNTFANGMGLIMAAGYGIAWRVVSFVLLIPISYMQSMSAFIAQNMGAKKPERAKRTLFYGMGTSVVTGLIVFYFVCFHGDVLASIFTSDQMCIRDRPHSTDNRRCRLHKTDIGINQAEDTES